MTRYRILVWLNGRWHVWHEGLALWQVELMFRPGMRVEAMTPEEADQRPQQQTLPQLRSQLQSQPA